MSQTMRRAANAQDKVGWRHFTEGKISTEIREMQQFYLLTSPTRISIESWMKGLIDQLLQLTHAQWIFRNITKHHHSNGTIKLAEREEVLSEIEKQLDLGIDVLPEESKFLLEIPPQELYSMRTDRQQYWLYAIQAARTASVRALQVSTGDTACWATVVADDKLTGLPTFTPLPPAESIPAPTPVPTVTQAQLLTRSRLDVTPSDIAAAKAAKKQVTAFRKRRRSGPGRSQTAAVPPISSQVFEKDNLSILVDVQPPQHQRKAFRDLLTKKNTRALARSGEDRVVIRGGNNRSDSITHSSFARLNEGMWLSDETINYFGKNIIQPSHTQVHFYSSFFFSKVMNDSSGYDFDSVRRWHNRIDGGLFGLDSLFIPINRDNEHWLLLQIQPRHKTVRLIDSLGVSQRNAAYLPTAIRYLHDVARSLNATELTLTDWQQDWTMEDISANSPRQINGYDCGIFTLVTSALLANKCGLDSSSYTQHQLYALGTRERIAYLLWTHGRVTSNQLTGWLIHPSQPPPANPTLTTPSAPPRTALRRQPSQPPSSDEKSSKRPRCTPDSPSTPPSSAPRAITANMPVASSQLKPPSPRPQYKSGGSQHKSGHKRTTIKSTKKPAKHSYQTRFISTSQSTVPSNKRTAKSSAELFTRTIGVPHEFQPTPRRKRKRESLPPSSRKVGRK